MRKRRATKRDVLADPIYNSKVVTKLVNHIMKDGKIVKTGDMSLAIETEQVGYNE